MQPYEVVTVVFSFHWWQEKLSLLFYPRSAIINHRGRAHIAAGVCDAILYSISMAFPSMIDIPLPVLRGMCFFIWLDCPFPSAACAMKEKNEKSCVSCPLVSTPWSLAFIILMVSRLRGLGRWKAKSQSHGKYTIFILLGIYVFLKSHQGLAKSRTPETKISGYRFGL